MSMTAESIRYGVREDFSHLMAEACQRFAGSILVLEPLAFAAAIITLVGEMPVAENPVEALLAWTSLRDVATRGAQSHHAWFHVRLTKSSCAFRPQPLPPADTFVSEKTFLTLRTWADDVSRAFEAHHHWPPAIRAVRVLQANHASDWYVEDLARTVNVSTATLERSFSRIYGVTARQYHSLLRLRALAQAIRADAGCLEGLILEAGCRSTKAIYAPLRRLAGLTLADVRRLTDAEFRALMSGPLRLPMPGAEA